jgi:CHAT domain-containing protein
MRCSDYVVSSYVPTLGSLLNARRAHKPIAKTEARALLAAVPLPYTDAYGSLPSTLEEIEAVKAAMPSESLVALGHAASALTVDEGVKAQTLLDRLPEATILHLACHGLQDATDPLKSGFVMQDERITIEKLMPLPLPRAFLAFLSACETAKGDKVRMSLLGICRARGTDSLRLTRTGPARPDCASSGCDVVCWLQERGRDSVVDE